MPARTRAVVVGSGVGGLAAAVRLASRGVEVQVLEAAACAGGKLREVAVGGARVDSGPTVFTLREVFDELFAAAGTRLDDHLGLRPLPILARHAWTAGERLDLHADRAASAEAIAAFAGRAEGERYLDFCRRAARIHGTLDRTFIRASRPGPVGLSLRVGVHRAGRLWGIAPFHTLWSALGTHFHDPRLRQLFARYATYVGSSPFASPATLMLIAHVEQSGVWSVEGGMRRIATSLEALARRCGAGFRFGARVRDVVVRGGRARGVVLEGGEQVDADVVVVNADAGALAGGVLGHGIRRCAPAVRPAQRSLSALTWSAVASTSGFPLERHNVFFSHDYAAEFADLFDHRRLPAAPTVYVCAQDRGDRPGEPPSPERLLCLVNAPPVGDERRFTAQEIDTCTQATFRILERCGLQVDLRPERTVLTTPADFEALFPGTGGALYGPASHGWRASFRRPGARTRIAGLYLAGGSVHPGAGVPMAAISGGLAAQSALEDLGSTLTSPRAAMPGGTSMPSATTAATD